MVMDKRISLRNDAVLYSVFGLFSCLIIGYLFAEKRAFVPISPNYAFFVYGVAGAVLFSVLKFSTIRNFLYGTALLLLLFVVWARISHVGQVFVQLLQLAGIATAIYGYHRFFEAPLRELKFGKFLALGGAVAAINFLLTLLVITFVDTPDAQQVIMIQTFFGFFIGSGLGIGFEIAEMTRAKLHQVRPV
jgi:hypothetical protein